jgi:7,8-dihydroneopterin aldolase/epimerase/oxygenase
MDLIKVGFKEAVFYTHHGVTELEQRLGNKLMVSCYLGFPASMFEYENLSSSIDYVEIYDCVQNQLEKSHHLLESLAIQIQERLRARFPQIKYFYIEIQKFNPPLNADMKGTVVIIEKNYA